VLVYHGVHTEPMGDTQHVIYSAGVMVLAEDDPLRVEYRSPTPTMVPTDVAGPRGTPSDVVFPTGLDRRDDLGQSDRIDVYYGKNDYRIGAASFNVPTVLPAVPAP
jgi:predicted GH43/DUF377 family glycosyl hydrolase